MLTLNGQYLREAGDARLAGLVAGKLPPGAGTSLLGRIHVRLADEIGWTSEGLEASLKALAEELGLGLGKLAQPLRAALTGQTTSPGIFDVLVLLGRDESLARIADQVAAAATQV